MEPEDKFTMLVAGERVASTPPRLTLHDSSHNRQGEVVGTPDRSGIGNGVVEKTDGAHRIPLSSPMISKRISTCNNPNGSNRRRVIFPFLPKTPEEESVSFHSVVVGGTYSRSAMEKSSDTVQEESPRVVCERFDFSKVGIPTLPLIIPSPPVKPRLLPRETSLSSQEETPCGPKKPLSFQDSSSSSIEEESRSDSATKAVQVILPPSILRRSKNGKATSGESVDKVPSVESDLPSLAGSSQSDSCEELRRIFPTNVRVDPVRSKTRAVAFDPRVWVREFERTVEERQMTWYSNKELECFKVAAVERIMAFSEQEVLPTGTGRMVPKRKALFSHRALQTDASPNKEALYRAVLHNEIRRILVVDSHDIFLKLFAKTLRPLLPHAEVVLAGSAAAALAEAQRGRFDLILVEERLKLLRLPNTACSTTGNQNALFQNTKPTNTTITCNPLPSDQESRSGAALMKRLQAETQGRALYIGVSAKLREDLPRLQNVSDVCWSKPPPHMNAKLVSDLLHKLLVKRQRFQAVAELFSTTTSTC